MILHPGAGTPGYRYSAPTGLGISHTPLPSTQHPVPITHYPLPITHYPVPITQHPLPSTHFPLSTLQSSVLFSVLSAKCSGLSIFFLPTPHYPLSTFQFPPSVLSTQSSAPIPHSPAPDRYSWIYSSRSLCGSNRIKETRNGIPTKPDYYSLMPEKQNRLIAGGWLQ